MANPQGKCLWKFKGYESSRWEQDWIVNYEKWQSDPCSFMRQRSFLERSDIWIRRNLFLANSDDRVPKPMIVDERLYSKMHYEEVCYDDLGEVIPMAEPLRAYQYIEPLVGILRDPMTICNAYTASLKKLVASMRLDNSLDQLQSKRFILLGMVLPVYV